jgi:hypothetical protein
MRFVRTLNASLSYAIHHSHVLWISRLCEEDLTKKNNMICSCHSNDRILHLDAFPMVGPELSPSMFRQITTRNIRRLTVDQTIIGPQDATREMKMLDDLLTTRPTLHFQEALKVSSEVARSATVGADEHMTLPLAQESDRAASSTVVKIDRLVPRWNRYITLISEILMNFYSWFSLHYLTTDLHFCILPFQIIIIQ